MTSLGKHIRALSWGERWAHVAALTFLSAASLSLRLFSMKRLSAIGADQRTATAEQNDNAQIIGETVARVARRSFWHPACLPQALATGWLLKRRNIPFEILLGVKRKAKGIEAHAWVRSGDTIIIGGEIRDEYEVIGPLHTTDVASES